MVDNMYIINYYTNKFAGYYHTKYELHLTAMHWLIGKAGVTSAGHSANT